MVSTNHYVGHGWPQSWPTRGALQARPGQGTESLLGWEPGGLALAPPLIHLRDPVAFLSCLSEAR